MGGRQASTQRCLSLFGRASLWFKGEACMCGVVAVVVLLFPANEAVLFIFYFFVTLVKIARNYGRFARKIGSKGGFGRDYIPAKMGKGGGRFLAWAG